MVGLAVRRWCAPVLGLPALASAGEYLARRGELGWREVTERFLAGAGVGTWLVDTGFVPEPPLAGLGVGVEREVVRVEAVAEGVAAEGESGRGLLAGIRAELRRRAAGAVGLKTVVGYRCGLRVPGVAPTDHEAQRAGERWCRATLANPAQQAEGASGARGVRLTEPVLLHWLVHEAALVCAELGLPLQVHTGFGDPDLRLREVDPALLSDFVESKPDTTVVLLHCWPYHRNAAYLAHVYGNVVVDIGLMVPFVGARTGEVLAEVLELAPFDAVVYSSDGRALPETHYLGAKLFRHHCGLLLDEWIADGIITAADAERLAHGIGAGTAARIYQLT
jgi:predicted TIM-barrel fold metal-dependent hydrolase